MDLLRPFDADEMTAWKVGKDVGNVKNDRPDLVEEITEPERPAPGGLGSLFAE